MATQAQIIANRRNAQRSTGPRTPSGKTLASQNSLKHGLLARRNVITTESQEEFDHHRDALLNELDAQTPMESMLADRIVSLSWRLKRADLTQNQVIDTLLQRSSSDPLAKLAKSFGLKGLALPQPDPADSNPDLILGRIALKDFSNERVLDRLLMYERRIEHSLYKTMLELQRLHVIRNLESPHSQQNLAPGFTGGSSQESPKNQPPTTPPCSPRDYAAGHNRTKQDPPEPPTISNQSADPLAAEPRRSARLVPGPVPAGRHHYAKRTQSQNGPDDPNTIQNKHLQQHQPSPSPKKRTQSNPIHPPQYAIQTSIPPRDWPLQTPKKTLQSTSHSCEMENPPLAEQESKILEKQC